jgi:hypothetical protein
MANWCVCELTLYVPGGNNPALAARTQQLRAAHDYLTEDNDALERAVTQASSKGRGKAGHDRARVADHKTTLEPYRCVMTFETAWAAPEDLPELLREKFPGLGVCLEYFECGMEFCGGVHIQPAGKVQKWHGPYFGLKGG